MSALLQQIKMSKNTFTAKKGFTLIEIIVALGIFALVMMITLGAILAIVGANKRAQAYHSVLNNLNLSIETMVRDLRTGYRYECNGSGDCPTNPGSSVTFVSNQYAQFVEDEDTEYHVEYGYDSAVKRIYKKVEGGEKQYLTSEQVEISQLEFYVNGTDSSDETQPQILILIRGSALIGGQRAQFNIQTFVSQRKLDI